MSKMTSKAKNVFHLIIGRPVLTFDPAVTGSTLFDKISPENDRLYNQRSAKPISLQRFYHLALPKFCLNLYQIKLGLRARSILSHPGLRLLGAHH